METTFAKFCSCDAAPIFVNPSVDGIPRKHRFSPTVDVLIVEQNNIGYRFYQETNNTQ